MDVRCTRMTTKIYIKARLSQFSRAVSSHRVDLGALDLHTFQGHCATEDDNDSTASN